MYVNSYESGKEKEMNEEKERIYAAALRIVSCTQSLKYITKYLAEMETDACRSGGEYQGVSNIVDMMAGEVEARSWEIIEVLGL